MLAWMTAFDSQVDSLPMSSDGKTLYASNSVTGIKPIDVASNAWLRPIRLAAAPAGFRRNGLVAVGPDGTAYVSFLQQHGQGQATLWVAPVSLATGRTGQPVNVGVSVDSRVQIVLGPWTCLPAGPGAGSRMPPAKPARQAPDGAVVKSSALIGGSGLHAR